MAKKPKINKVIREAGGALTEIMKDKLTVISNDLIRQVMAKRKRLIPSQKIKAINGIAPKGVNDYKDALKQAFSIIATDAIDQARKEVPKAKHVKLTDEKDSIQLSDFDNLPPDLRNKIQTMLNLLTGKQIGDLQKVIEFAYATAEDETDSDDQILKDLQDSSIGWLDGTAIELGANLNASTVINNARSAFFADEEVSQQIEAFEFLNGDPVTEICQDLDGTIFAKDDPGADRYQPPLHWNCKSYVVPILMGDLGDREIEKLAPSRKSLEDQVQFHEHFDGPCKIIH